MICINIFYSGSMRIRLIDRSNLVDSEKRQRISIPIWLSAAKRVPPEKEWRVLVR